MPADDRTPWVQLATRIPKTLQRAVKLHCVATETTVMAFVVAAIEQALARGPSKTVRRPRAKR